MDDGSVCPCMRRPVVVLDRRISHSNPSCCVCLDQTHQSPSPNTWPSRLVGISAVVFRCRTKESHVRTPETCQAGRTPRVRCRAYPGSWDCDPAAVACVGRRGDGSFAVAVAAGAGLSTSRRHEPPPLCPALHPHRNGPTVMQQHIPGRSYIIRVDVIGVFFILSRESVHFFCRPTEERSALEFSRGVQVVRLATLAGNAYTFSQSVSWLGLPAAACVRTESGGMDGLSVHDPSTGRSDLGIAYIAVDAAKLRAVAWKAEARQDPCPPSRRQRRHRGSPLACHWMVLHAPGQATSTQRLQGQARHDSHPILSPSRSSGSPHRFPSLQGLLRSAICRPTPDLSRRLVLEGIGVAKI
jgi:hypothetical protein